MNLNETESLEGRSEVELEQITALTRVSGPVVVGKQVGGSTGNVAGSASSRLAGRVGGADGETHGGEFGVITHVDAGEIPPDSGVLVGVLVLQDVGLLRAEGDLDGDSTAVGVGAPVLGVGFTAIEGVHVAGDVRHGPEVDGLFHVVDDLDAIAGDVGALLACHQLAVHGVGMVAHVVEVVHSREGRCNGAEGSEKSEGLGEHVVSDVCFRNKKGILMFGLKECIQSFQKTV